MFVTLILHYILKDHKLLVYYFFRRPTSSGLYGLQGGRANREDEDSTAGTYRRSRQLGRGHCCAAQLQPSHSIQQHVTECD